MPSYEKFKAILDILQIRPFTVSKGTNIASAVFSDWKSGKSKPKINKIKIIAEFLGVKIEELLE